jgi:hypothetical protein
VNDNDTQEFRVSIPTDKDGLTSRQCPKCQAYFKIRFGTGLKGKDLPCHCPYCGRTGEPSSFHTKEQVEYARSVVLNQVTQDLLDRLKEMEFDHPAQGAFGIGVSMKVRGEPHPIHYYRDKQLETQIICDSCTLLYAIYGVFAFCPDWGVHNSLQILNKNFEIIEKEINLAGTVESDLAEHLIGDALENVVSAFDGFGRSVCRAFSTRASAPSKAENISFQNLNGGKKRVQDLFGFDLNVCVTPDEWDSAIRGFQKRHLITHKMGIVDAEYLSETRDPQAAVGRKVSLTPDEVKALIGIVQKLGTYLYQKLQ